MMFLFAPHILSVKSTMLSLTSLKLVNFLPLISSGKTAKGVVPSSMWLRRSSSGLLVTTPSPRGKKSRPTIDSRTEDLPADCEPSTAILGRLMYCCSPQSLSSSYHNSVSRSRFTYNNIDEFFKLVVHKFGALLSLLASSFGVGHTIMLIDY